MFGIRHLKAPPTTHVMLFKSGQLKAEGPGLSFFHFAPTSTLVMVPLSSRVVPFALAEMGADFQPVTLQGELTWRVTAPRQLAELMDYTVDGAGRYLSEDPSKLQERLAQAALVAVRAAMQGMTLRRVLTSADQVAATALGLLRQDDGIQRLGLEVLGLLVLSVRPSPDTTRALEAEAREALHRQADEAIYARRNAAVEKERVIKESELKTELAVEERRRQIRESQMAADISVEEQRQKLMDQRVANERKEAESRAHALRAILEQVRDVDWRTLMALGAQGGDAGLQVALAFRELAQNAQKIGELHITPELLTSLRRPERKAG